jgi:uncharacterized protein
MSSLVIDVGDLRGAPGATKEIQTSEAIHGLQGALGRISEEHPLTLDLIAESMVDGIAVSGDVQATIHLVCSRCLIEFDQQLDVSINEVFYFSTPEDEGYEVEGRTIDLEPLLRDVLVLAIPIRPLHTKACKGICAICGADLNEFDCGHREEVADLRWAPLKALLERKTQSKEM